MNPALQGIFARRSVRKFKNKDVPEETVNDALEAAMAAPSAVARDPAARTRYSAKAVHREKW